MKPKSHVAIIQKREGREETLCPTTSHKHWAQRDTVGCTLPWTRGVNLEH